MTDPQDDKPDEPVEPKRGSNPTTHPEPSGPAPPPTPRRRNGARSEAGWLTLDEAADYTGRHRETVRRAAVDFQRSKGKRGVRAGQNGAGACWRFKADDLDRWVMGEPPARIRAA